MIVFKNADVAAKYTTDQTDDKIHHLPGGKNKNGWKGLLSEIPLAQADRWISRPGQNLIRLKEEEKKAPSKNKEEAGKN
jgi:hypothetical protein